MFCSCNSGGAGKWGAEHARALYGAEVVVVVADKDDAGRAHAVQVAKSLRGHVGQVVIMEALVGKDASGPPGCRVQRRGFRGDRRPRRGL